MLGCQEINGFVFPTKWLLDITGTLSVHFTSSTTINNKNLNQREKAR
jgi:hypothetical protein